MSCFRIIWINLLSFLLSLLLLFLCLLWFFMRMWTIFFWLCRFVHPFDYQVPHIIDVFFMFSNSWLIFNLFALYLKRTKYEINEELIIKFIVVYGSVKLIFFESKYSFINKTCVKTCSEKLISILMSSKMTSSNQYVSFNIYVNRKNYWEIGPIVFLWYFSNIYRAKDHLFSFENLNVRWTGRSFQPIFFWIRIISISSHKSCFNIWNTIHNDSL